MTSTAGRPPPTRPAPVAVAPRPSRWVPVRRRLATVGVVAGAVVSTVMTATIAGQSYSLVGAGNPWLVGIGTAVNLAAAVGLVWRYRWPWVVWGLAVVGPLLLITDGFAALCALVVLLRTRWGPRVAAATALTYLAAVVSLTWDTGRDDHYSALLLLRPRTAVGDATVPLWVPWLVALVLVASAVGLGLLLRASSALAVAEQTTRLVSGERTELREEVVRAQERARVARDVHDGLSTLLTRISLHAGALQVRDYGGLAAAERAEVLGSAELIWDTAHEANDALGLAVGALRGPGAGPDLDEVPALVRGFRRDGLRAVLTLDVAPDPPPEASRLALRVLREALGNAVRYAAAPEALVRVVADPGRGVEVEVRSPLPPRPPASRGTGTGLAGLAEAVHTAGGRLDAGPRGGEFVVRAGWSWDPVGRPG